MMPSEYLKNAVDYDGDGKRNLIKSPADVIGSTAKYLVSLGWKRGEPWLQEVRVSQQMPWAEADLAIQHTRAEWVKWGVTYPGGRALPADNVLFWPLFNHISRRGIEMTTPVVNTYTPGLLESDQAKATPTGAMAMEFVYRTPTLGEAGQGVLQARIQLGQ